MHCLQRGAVQHYGVMHLWGISHMQAGCGLAAPAAWPCVAAALPGSQSATCRTITRTAQRSDRACAVQAAVPVQNPPVMRSLFGNPMGQDRSYKRASDWAHAEPAPMAPPISTPPTQRWWSTPASTASVSPAVSTPVAPTWY